MGEVTPELQKNIFKLMELKYIKHKKIMIWTGFFIAFYTIAVFVVLTQYVYDNMFVNINLIFVEIGYDVRGCFRLLTIFYLFIMCFYFSFNRLDSSKSNNIYFYKGRPIYKDIGPLLLKSLKGYYFLFNFFLVWPSLFVAVSDFPILGNIGKIMLGISPILFYFLRFFIVDFVGSDRIVRKIFKGKDANVWNCPACHEYILKKPVASCPHCGMKKFGKLGLFIGKYCKHCGFKSVVGDFDFPKYCPHCGLRFK